jgi:hypothetical protein
MRGRVCHLSVFVNTVYSGQYLHKFLHCVRHSLHLQYLKLNTYTVLYTFTIHFNKIQYVQYIQASFSPGFAQQSIP